MKCLMLRVGGLGDCLILTPVAKALYGRGFEVDYFVGSPTGDLAELFDGLPYIHSSKKLSRLNGIDCITDESGNFISVEILKEKYDEVFDFKFSVEDNRAGINKTDGWRSTINSNYMNWVDLSLAWAGIDWTTVSSEDKRPEFILPDSYVRYVNENTIMKDGKDFKVIGIQLQASTLIRSWYKATTLPGIIHAKYPNDVVLVFANSRWIAFSKYGQINILNPDGMNPILFSAALIKQMDCFISADTGMGHVAEALGVPTISVYTTVPPWTRMKYYKYTIPIEANVPCHPCFSLDLFCPLERKKAYESLSERERDILKSVENGISLDDIARKYSTAPMGTKIEYEAAKKRSDALSATEPACVHSITSDVILEKLQGVLK